jgi:membrane-associated phospholipid phosphatase
MKTGNFKKISIILALLILILPVQVRAEEIEDPGESNAPQLRYDLKMDIAVTAIAAAGFLGTTIFEEQLAPDSCHWCSANSFDDWGHQNLKWSNARAANIGSHVTAFVIAPMVAFGFDALAASHDGRLDEFPVDALLIVEATSIAAMSAQIFKFATGRQRPSAHYSTTSVPSNDDNLSFYSAHTSIAFALAVSSGTIASMREYELAPLIWGSGLAVAATTGYLRLGADKHYLTDVIAGSIIGSAIGFCVPYFFHRPKNINFSVAQIDGGGMMSLHGTF